MGKFTLYLLLLSVLLILFHFAGLITDTTTTPISLLISWLTNPDSIRNTNWYEILLGAGALIGFAGIAVSLFVNNLNQNIELYVKFSIMAVFVAVGWDFLIIFNLLQSISTFLAVLLLSPFILIYFIAAIEWWGGKD